MNAKPSLFSNLYLSRNEIKITSKQRTISQKSRGWDNILWTLILDYTIELLELDAFSLQE